MFFKDIGDLLKRVKRLPLNKFGEREVDLLVFKELWSFSFGGYLNNIGDKYHHLCFVDGESYSTETDKKLEL